MAEGIVGRRGAIAISVASTIIAASASVLQKTVSIPFPYAPKRPQPYFVFAHRPHAPNFSILIVISSDLAVAVEKLI